MKKKQEFIEQLNKEGYKLITDYIKAIDRVILRCDIGHEYKVRPNDFKNGHRCPQCQGSTGQRKLQQMLIKRGLDMIFNDRKALSGYELDIWFPELMLAIEYQGNYWHNRPEVIERDRRKKIMCEEKGITLIEVWDDEFINNPKLIEHELYQTVMGGV